MRTVSFSFYHDTYHGALSEDVFNRHVYPAAALVDDLTMSRASGDLTEDELLRVNLALCAVIDARADNAEMGGATSMENDGVSVSYAAQYVQDGAKRERDAAVLYLAQTNLLYRGVG